jgi:hypothetical protein
MCRPSASASLRSSVASRPARPASPSPTYPVSRGHFLSHLVSRLTALPPAFACPIYLCLPLSGVGSFPRSAGAKGRKGRRESTAGVFESRPGASATFLRRALRSVGEAFAPRRYTHRPSPFSARVRADQSPSTPACSGGNPRSVSASERVCPVLLRSRNHSRRILASTHP